MGLFVCNNCDQYVAEPDVDVDDRGDYHCPDCDGRVL